MVRNVAEGRQGMMLHMRRLGKQGDLIAANFFFIRKGQIGIVLNQSTVVRGNSPSGAMSVTKVGVGNSLSANMGDATQVIAGEKGGISGRPVAVLEGGYQ